MRKHQLRRRIAVEAAKLLADGRETDFTTAKRRAARILGVRFTLNDFPSTREIRDALKSIEELTEGGTVQLNPLQLQIEALRLLRLLRPFQARLVAPLTAEEIHSGLETALAASANSSEDVIAILTAARLPPVVVEAPTPGKNQRSVLLIPGDYPAKLMIFPAEADMPEGISVEAHEHALREQGIDLDAELAGVDDSDDRFLPLEDILSALEDVHMDPATHPEGDALHHALQLFDLAYAEAPYDEEFLSAALFHDAGSLGVASDRIRQTYSLLDRLVTRRTLQLIEAVKFLTDEIPAPQHPKTVLSPEDMADAQRLAELDRQARKPGAATRSPEEAIAILRNLEEEDWWKEEAKE